MMSGCLLEFVGVSGPVAMTGWILKYTEIDEIYVLGMALVVFAVASMLIVREVSGKSMRRGFAFFCVICVVALTGMGFVQLGMLVRICEESDVVEWLGAHFLLAAWVIGLVLTIRLARRKRPSPMAALMTGGYFWGFWRELEFGAPFFGNKFLYTRNFFRPEAYLNPAYLEQFNKSLGHEEYRPLFVMHWVGVGAMLVCISLLGAYLYRHRAGFVEELKKLRRTTYGRYFFLGIGMYLGSQAVGRVIKMVYRSGIIPHRWVMYALSKGVISEPVETLGALSFMLSMIAFWGATRSQSEPILQEPDPAQPS